MLHSPRVSPTGEAFEEAGEPVLPIEKPFDLLRYFTGSALAVVVIATVVLASTSAWLVHRSFLDMEKDESDSIAEDMVSDLRAAGFDLDRWGAAGPPAALRDATLAQMDNFGITEFTLYSLGGDALEDFAVAGSGTRSLWREGLDRATSGETALRWEAAYGGGIPWFRAKRGGAVESYAPVRDHGKVVAVARVRRNEAPNLAKAEDVLPLLIGIALGGGILVFGALWLLALKADRTLKRQHRGILAAQAELARRNVLLAELNRRKDEFYAMCSHDLRMPLVSVEAGCRLLLTAGGTEEQRREVILENLRNSSVVLDLLNNLVDLARIDEQEDAIQSAVLDLRGLVEGVVAANRPYAESRGVALEVDLPGDGVLVNGDRLKLVRILNNLLSNAIKHGDGKPVRVAIDRTAAGARIRVEDRGPGLAPEIRSDLLTGRDLSRAPGPGRAEDSHGLGLSIVRRLVDLHGGRLEVQAGRDSGTTFLVTLPPVA